MATKPQPKLPTAEALEKSYKASKKSNPSWSLGIKPQMVCDKSTPVPSWVKQIPGPKYIIDTDKFKARAPSWGFQPIAHKPREKLNASKSDPGKLPTPDQIDAGWKATTKQGAKYSLGEKPTMVIGDAVPSWVKSIPGPIYNPVVDTYKHKPPVYSIGTKLEFVVGSGVPSWVKSIPGPKYNYSTDHYKPRQPSYAIGEKLPTEGDIMSTRSPGPIYGGSAIDAVKQSQCDSTKKRTCAPSFGIGPRWSGSTYDLILSGAAARFEHGKHAYG